MNSILKKIDDFPQIGDTIRFTWRSPSNIALVKYWGKHGIQRPKNPSLSFSLNNSFTETTMVFSPKKKPSDQISFDFYFENNPQPAFEKRLYSYLSTIKAPLPFLNNFHIRIKSRNTFPHSSGIASSASSLSALALGLISMEQKLYSNLSTDDDFLRRASYFSRLGSGSASRSVYKNFCVWGKVESVQGSHDEYAIPINQGNIHPAFSKLHDAILIIDSNKKGISSSNGHRLMDNHPYANIRFEVANNHLQQILDAMHTGDWDTFSLITEREALNLHAMMMTSSSPYLLLKPNSLRVMEKIIAKRNNESLPVCYTIDAGPNLHLIYPEAYEKKVKDFIYDELLVYCEANKWIDDKMGNGPLLIETRENEN